MKGHALLVGVACRGKRPRSSSCCESSLVILKQICHGGLVCVRAHRAPLVGQCDASCRRDAVHAVRPGARRGVRGAAGAVPRVVAARAAPLSRGRALAAARRPSREGLARRGARGGASNAAARARGRDRQRCAQGEAPPRSESRARVLAMGAGQRESHAPFPSPRKVCHAIAEEATHTEWPELLPHVATALQPTGGASAQCAPTLYFLLEKLIEAGPQRMCAHAPASLMRCSPPSLCAQR